MRVRISEGGTRATNGGCELTMPLTGGLPRSYCGNATPFSTAGGLQFLPDRPKVTARRLTDLI